MQDELTITLEDMLNAREQRAYRQRTLLAQYGVPMAVLTMNIAGPIKRGEWIDRGFALGCADAASAAGRACAACTRTYTPCAPATAFMAVDAVPALSARCWT